MVDAVTLEEVVLEAQLERLEKGFPVLRIPGDAQNVFFDEGYVDRESSRYVPGANGGHGSYGRIKGSIISRPVDIIVQSGEQEVALHGSVVKSGESAMLAGYNADLLKELKAGPVSVYVSPCNEEHG